MAFTPLILFHAFSASSALVIGGMALAVRKGSVVHRIAGRLWILLMVAAALSSFGIRSSGHFSWIHLLSLLMLFGITGAMVAVMRGNIPRHRRIMKILYPSLVVTALFTLLPGRRLGELLWTNIGLI